MNHAVICERITLNRRYTCSQYCCATITISLRAGNTASFLRIYVPRGCKSTFGKAAPSSLNYYPKWWYVQQWFKFDFVSINYRALMKHEPVTRFKTVFALRDALYVFSALFIRRDWKISRIKINRTRSSITLFSIRDIFAFISWQNRRVEPRDASRFEGNSIVLSGASQGMSPPSYFSFELTKRLRLANPIAFVEN